jgi:hypothetical protein
MCISRCLRRATWIAALAVGVVGFTACDTPSSGPSFETETGLNTPVVVNKTFTFLGGPESQNEPLIDTTTSQFDSLFTVAESDQSLSIEEEVSSLDIGSLDEALDEATEGVGADTSISETVIQGNDLATQNVDVDQFSQENGVPPPTPENSSPPLAVGDTTLPFPPALLSIPDFEVASIRADTVRSGTFTQNTIVDGTPVNRITFELFNDPFVTADLTDGNGNGPKIDILDENGTLIATADFGSDPVSPGETESVTVGIEGATLGENSDLDLRVVGSDTDPEDELTVELSPLEYNEARLADIETAQVNVTESGLSIRGSGESQFAGIETQSGTLTLTVTNDLQFPVQVDSLILENNFENPRALPDDFPSRAASENPEISIPEGGSRTIDVDLQGDGIAQRVDVRVRGQRANNSQTLTAAASDAVEVAANGPLTIDAMFFWPDGEEVQASGTFDFEQDRISFDKPRDFVELDAGTLALDNLVSEPTVVFDSFVLSFPDIRGDDYGPEDSLTVEFSVPAENDPQIEDESLGGLRLFPTNNEVEYNLQGTLEAISAPDQTPENLRVIRFADEVRTDVSVENLDVRALDTGVNPFSVDVTEDANGDGDLDLADTTEATQEPFEDFEDVAGTVDGLELEGSELNFQVTTDVGTDAQLYAALQGRDGNERTFLAGKPGSPNNVPQSAPLGDDFVRDNTTIARENLVRFGVEGAPTDDPVTTSIRLTNENSTVDDFLSTLPTSLRFVAQARLTGDENDRIRLRRPLQFETGLSVTVPLTLNNSFVVEDTIDADFSSLEDVTDPDEDVTVSTAELRVKYANGVPLGADATFGVLDDSETEVLTLPGDDDPIVLQPAPKSDNGTSNGARSGKTTLDLNEQQLRALSEGRSVVLRLTMNQVDDGTAATLRATDTIDLSLEAKVEASVSVNE